MSTVLILRPTSGATETAARARALGLATVATPIFTIRAIGWTAPVADELESVLLTSANAVRCAGEALGGFVHLPCYAVGETTAAAARDAGFRTIVVGPSDGAALVEWMVADGVQSALHPCGRDHVGLAHPRVTIVRRIVYAAEPVAGLPDAARDAIADGALVLLHSPRAAAHFAALVEGAGIEKRAVRIAAISAAALRAAGPGWKSGAAAPAPRDEALLELAAKLCQTARLSDTG